MPTVAIHCSGNQATQAGHMKDAIELFTQEGLTWTATVLSDVPSPGNGATYDLIIYHPWFWPGYWDSEWDELATPILITHREVLDEANILLVSEPDAGNWNETCVIRVGADHPILDHAGLVPGDAYLMIGAERGFKGTWPSAWQDLARTTDTNGVDYTHSRLGVIEAGEFMHNATLPTPARRAVFGGHDANNQHADWLSLFESICLFLVGELDSTTHEATGLANITGFAHGHAGFDPVRETNVSMSEAIQSAQAMSATAQKFIEVIDDGPGAWSGQTMSAEASKSTGIVSAASTSSQTMEASRTSTATGTAPFWCVGISYESVITAKAELLGFQSSSSSQVMAANLTVSAAMEVSNPLASQVFAALLSVYVEMHDDHPVATQSFSAEIVESTPVVFVPGMATTLVPKKLAAPTSGGADC